MYEEYEVTFKDGTSTVFWVGEDESIQGRAIANAEAIGFDPIDIASIRPTGNVMNPYEEE